ncbi:MAG: nucleotidyltransferase family protein [Planctomycetes bacterium]|nr:nucleotidyltransferase family protein [Planctomycetota bacterium]
MKRAQAPRTRPEAVAALVLAAGRSSRMGVPKALLDLDGESALERVLRVLGEAGVRELLVVVDPAQEDVVGALRGRPFAVVENPAPESGQSGSIRRGLARISRAASAFLLCPVDVPLFEAADVRALLEAREHGAPRPAIVLPTFRGRRGHPVLCDSSLAPEFLALGEDEPAHNVIRRDPARVLQVELGNGELVADLDTPEDYQEALSRLRARRAAR